MRYGSGSHQMDENKDEEKWIYLRVVYLQSEDNRTCQCGGQGRGKIWGDINGRFPGRGEKAFE